MSFPFIAIPSPWYQESKKISAPKCNPIFSAVPQGQNSLVSSINANKLGIRQWQIDEVVTPWDTSLFSVLIMGRIKLSRGFIWLWKCPHLRTPPHVFLPRRIRPCLLCVSFLTGPQVRPVSCSSSLVLSEEHAQMREPIMIPYEVDWSFYDPKVKLPMKRWKKSPNISLQEGETHIYF